MKTRLVIAGLACCFNLVLKGQDNRIKENISKAEENNGIEYFANGTIKSVVNITKVEYYYNWITTADTINIIDQLAGWDFTSLKSFYKNYIDEKPNFEEQIRKCHLIAEELREFNSMVKSDTLQIAHLNKR